MGMTPKGPRANVHDMDTARIRKAIGRPSGLGYDPATGEEYASKTLEMRGTDPETDVFALIGGRGYSETRFYTKSTDAKGHGKTIRVFVPQGIDAQVIGVVNAVPEYRSLPDFIRDAVVHRLEYLQKRYKMSETSRRFLELERLRSDSDHRSHDIETMTETVKDVNEKLTKAWDAEDYGILAQELEVAGELLDWMREPYRGQVKQLLAGWKARSKDMVEKHQAEREE